MIHHQPMSGRIPALRARNGQRLGFQKIRPVILQPRVVVRAAEAEAAGEDRTAKTGKKGTGKTAKAPPGGEAAAGGESGSTRKPRRADASEAS